MGIIIFIIIAALAGAFIINLIKELRLSGILFLTAIITPFYLLFTNIDNLPLWALYIITAILSIGFAALILAAIYLFIKNLPAIIKSIW